MNENDWGKIKIALKNISVCRQPGRRNLSYLPRPFIAPLSLILLTTAAGVADSQEASKPSLNAAADVAAAVADMNATIVFQSVVPHDNFVEVRYKAMNARLFPQSKVERDKRQIGLTLQFCARPGIASGLKNGVVVRQILLPADDGHPFEFSIDQSACDNIIALAEKNRQEQFRPQSKSEPKRVPTITVRPNP